MAQRLGRIHAVLHVKQHSGLIMKNSQIYEEFGLLRLYALSVQSDPSGWSRFLILSCLAGKSNTVTWVKCHILAVLAYMLRKRLLKHVPPFQFKHGEHLITLDPSKWAGLNSVITHQLHEDNPNLPVSQEYTQLGALMGLNASTASRWQRTWQLRQLLEYEQLLPVLPSPQFFANFFHHDPVTPEQGKEVFQLMVQRVKDQCKGQGRALSQTEAISCLMKMECTQRWVRGLIMGKGLMMV